ncbi:hypothetical protein ACOSQ4_032215 [Xanthoceras sorbifolium]
MASLRLETISTNSISALRSTIMGNSSSGRFSGSPVVAPIFSFSTISELRTSLCKLCRTSESSHSYSIPSSGLGSKTTSFCLESHLIPLRSFDPVRDVPQNCLTRGQGNVRFIRCSQMVLALQNFIRHNCSTFLNHLFRKHIKSGTLTPYWFRRAKLFNSWELLPTSLSGLTRTTHFLCRRATTNMHLCRRLTHGPILLLPSQIILIRGNFSSISTQMFIK